MMDINVKLLEVLELLCLVQLESSAQSVLNARAVLPNNVAQTFIKTKSDKTPANLALLAISAQSMQMVTIQLKLYAVRISIV